MTIILWAHRRFSSRVQTHYAPFPPSRAAGVTAASNPQSTRRGQALPPDLRRTRLTLTNIARPNRLPSQRLSFAPCLFAAPKGVHAARRRAVSAAAPCARQRQPKSLPSFATPSSTPNKMRPTQSNAIQNTSTLRWSGSFGFGRFVALQRSANGRRWPLRQYLPPYRGRPLTCHQPPLPKALRPPLHLSKRYAANVGQLPRLRDSVRPLSVQRPQLPHVGRISAGGAARVD